MYAANITDNLCCLKKNQSIISLNKDTYVGYDAGFL